MQLRLAHHAPQAQEQAVVVVRRIVEAVGVGDERPPQGAQIQSAYQSALLRARRLAS